MNKQTSNFSDRLNKALDAYGYPAKGDGRQLAVGKDFGVSQKAARKWMEGESMPKTSRIYEIATRLKVRAEWLLTGRGPMQEDAPGVSETTAQCDARQAPKIPLLSPADASKWIADKESTNPLEWLDRPSLIGPFGFAIRMEGDSMFNPHGAPTIPENALVYIDPETHPESGKIVAVALGEGQKTTIKRLIVDGPNTYLNPLNPNYKPIIASEQCEIIGVAKLIALEL